MSGSSPPAGPATREIFRRTLGASPQDLANHVLIPAPPDMQIPGFTVPYTDSEHINGNYFHSAAQQPMHPAKNTHHLQASNATHSMIPFTGNQYHQNTSGSYGSFQQQYEANKFSSPLYQDNSDNVFAQNVPQSIQPHNYVANNSDSDNESENGEGQTRVQVFQGFIRNEQHYNDAQARRLRKGSQSGHADDIPEEEEEQRALVKKLFESIINTEDVVDKPSKDGKPAQAVRRFRSGFYSSKDIEIKCWEIFVRCRDTTLGVKLPGLDSKSKREYYEGFHARYNKIIESCKMSKALCKQIMDPTYISRLVAAPGTEIQMKFNNKKINAERDIQNEIGRKAVKRGIKLNDLDRLINSEAASASSLVDPALTDMSNQQLIAASPGETGLQPKLEIEGGLSAQSGPEGSMKSPNTPRTPKDIATPKNSSSSKRKIGSSKFPNGQSTFDVGESDSEYEGSPAKRKRPTGKARSRNVQPRRHGSGKSQGVNNKVLSVMNPSAPLMAGTAAMTLASSSPTVQQPSNQKLCHLGAIEAALDSQPMSSFSGFDDDEDNSGLSFQEEISVALVNEMEMLERLESHYKVLICRVLGVADAYSEVYNLHELRTYARAYNSEFGSQEWRLGGNMTAFGYVLFRDRALVAPHFSQELKIYLTLGIARGDVDDNGQCLFTGPGKNGFSTQTEPEIRQALGLEGNQFGTFLP